MKSELVALFLVLFVAIGGTAAIIGRDSLQGPAGEIAIVARTPLDGNWSQREIRVRQGETVRLRLTSEDVTHGFYVPDLNVNAGPIAPGKFKTVEFVADRPGTFNFYCNILCSHEHGAMIGKIVVSE